MKVGIRGAGAGALKLFSGVAQLSVERVDVSIDVLLSFQILDVGLELLLRGLLRLSALVELALLETSGQIIDAFNLKQTLIANKKYTHQSKTYWSCSCVHLSSVASLAAAAALFSCSVSLLGFILAVDAMKFVSKQDSENGLRCVYFEMKTKNCFLFIWNAKSLQVAILSNSNQKLLLRLN